MKKEPQPEEKSDGQDLKEVIWWPQSMIDELKKDWPDFLKQRGGYQLFLVQQGKDPNNYRPMPTLVPVLKRSNYRTLTKASIDLSISQNSKKQFTYFM